MELTKMELEEIAAHIGGGTTCYLHKVTKDIIPMFEDEIGFDDWGDEDPAEFKKEDYYVFEPMETHKSFRMMRSFAGTLADNPDLQQKLYEALEGRKPFQQFKTTIDYSGENNREKWFAFRDEVLGNYILNRLKFLEDQEMTE